MSFSHLNLIGVRFVMILVLIVGMLGMTPVRPARAAAITVTNTNASGPGSFASAVASAQFSETIVTFHSSLAGQTITLVSQINFNTLFNLTIDGSGLNPPVIISGGNISGILKINGLATLSISNITFTQAVAEEGAAIQVTSSTNLSVENCTFLQNYGGAIEASGNADVTIVNSIFNQNQGGAVIFSGNGTRTIVDSVFTENSSGGNGGAIYAPGDLTLIDSTLSGNVATSGGAIYTTNLVMKNSTLDRNQAKQDGGAMVIAGNGVSTIINSTIFQNQAGDDGGAIFAQGNVGIEIFNSTFAKNSAIDGEEVLLSGNISFIANNTIFVCTAESNTDNCYIQGIGAVVFTDYGTFGVGTLNDYGLAELADNGGPTQTMALLPDSPLIDAGDDSTCANSNVNNLDQRGAARPQGSQCDIGAYEDQSLVRYVKQDAMGTGDGSSWTNAHTDLQSAFTAASPDEEIWVAAGAYKPTSTTDRAISFSLKNGVAVYGGFAGTETARAQRNYETNLTVLSGDIGVQGDKSDNSYRVVVANNTNTSALLDGFTITGGNANDASINSGGGMDVKDGSPSLRNVIFTNNYATFGGGMHARRDPLNNPDSISPVLTNVTFFANSAVEGGGMRNFEFSSPILTDVIFDSNSVTRTGGGMENFNYSNPALTNVTFINNTAGELGAGGGMYNWIGNIPILMNVTFTGNTARWGGGMGNHQSSPILRNVVFNNNSASWYGGGMSNENSSNPRLTDVTFDGNTAASDTEETAAGAMHNRQSSPILTNVTFKNNSANYIGGGMVNSLASSPDLVNVTFRENSAEYGGAIVNSDSDSRPTLTHVTISNNTASIGGGAIANNGNPVIKNSILWGNTGGEIFNLSGTPVITYSIVQGGYAGTGNIDQDPLLGSLQNNGGFTQTMALGNGSPAINAAEDTVCPSTDQRGVTRPQGSHCDMGAYEYNTSTVDVFIGDIKVDSYLLAPQESQRQSYAGINSGPVKLINADDASIMAAERVIYKINGIPTSFSEMMGLPNSQLDTTYWLPWYNNVDLDTQLRFANVSTLPTTVTITIGGQPVGNPIQLAAGASTRVSFAGVNNGPVKIVSTQNIVAAQRVIYKINGVNTSFNEMMALPASQVDTTFWMPWYNNVDLDTQLRFANVSSSPATVTVTIGGVAQPSINLAAGESTRVSYTGVNNGPVKIVSTQNIVAAQRVIYKVKGVNTSFSETMALPASQVDTTFWLPWYNNVDLDTQLRIANVSGSSAAITVTIGGVPQPSFNLSAGQSTRISFASINNGPVKIESTQNIVVAERVIYKVNGVQTSFSEMMALPKNSLDATFWFPWYNNVDLDTQLRFGVP